MNASRSSFSVLSLLALLALSSASCALEGRGATKELEERQVLRKQVSTLQASTADINTRFQDIEEDQRRLSGRLENIETRQAQEKSASSKGTQAIEQKLKETDSAYREEFVKLKTEVEQLKSQLAEIQEGGRRASQAAAKAEAQSAKDPFAAAEEKFAQKSWREAILDYERYRKANPKGKQFSTATYKIGVSFQELGMVDEARAFYEEVVSKFPKSKDAGRANTKLKALKK